jgi:hypothetical protein
MESSLDFARSNAGLLVERKCCIPADFGKDNSSLHGAAEQAGFIDSCNLAMP